MKLFLFQWPVGERAYVDALSMFAREGHSVDYVVYSADPTLARKHLPRAIFHSHENAYDGEPAGEFRHLAVPPSASLVRSMASVESLVLSMMNKHFDYMSIDERKQVYFDMLGYWYAVLTERKPDALVFSAVPHSVYDYLCYELAKLLGIRTVVFDYTLVGDRYLYMSDFRKGSDALLRSLGELKQTQVTADMLVSDVRDYYLRAKDEHTSRVPLYVAEDKKKYSPFNVFKLRGNIAFQSFKDRSFFKKAMLFFFKVFGENVKKEYASIIQKPDLSEPFVYVPLNYQPECTTSPQGDIFVIQTLMLETLSEALPEGWHLYVKEHPSQWGPRGLNYSSSRYRGYYRRIARLPNVTLVPLELKSSVLIERARAVATVSGTAAWEALLRGKLAIIFGHPWYQNAPNLMRGDSVESCKRCFKAISDGFKVREEDTLRFLKALELSTVPGHFQEYSKRHSSVTGEESARDVVSVVLQALRTS